MKVKVKDIAQAAGVSPATVSLVLNNKPSRISPGTQELIRSIARDMQMKQGQTSGNSYEYTAVKTIGLVVADVKNQYFTLLTGCVNEYMNQQGYTVFQCNAMNSGQKCLKAVNELLVKNVNGIIVIPPYHINNEQDNVSLRQCVEESPVPVVLLDQAVHGLFTDFITSDNKQGGYLATKYLLDLGHRKIGCILGPEGNYTARKRLEGYRRALDEAEVAYEESLVIHGEYDLESGANCAEQLIRYGVTAIFATNDLMALGVYRHAEREKIKIPEQLSVVGYDNTMICELLAVGLTSIEQSIDSMGAKAGEVLCGRMEGDTEEAAPRNYYFSPVLIERESAQRLC